ncbi:MAG: ABC transporter ATP-binding protein [Ruminococcaceae bacterium]|nr:ABC transporter ATP-binding protein [Oscillospiraceae bacterium]
MKRIIDYCKPFAGMLTLMLCIKFIGTMMDLVIPYLLGYILDEVVPAKQIAPVFFWGGMMVLCALVAVFSNIFANRRIARISTDVVKKIRSDMFDKILSLSASQTDSFTVPSLVARMSSDTYSIHNMLNMTFRAGVRAPILLLGGILITLFIEPVLSLTLIAILPLMAIIVIYVSKKGIRLFKTKQKKVDRMVEKVRDTFTGIRVIKALSQVDHEKDSFGEINSDLSHSEEKANVTMAITPATVTLCLNLGMTAVVLLGAIRVQSGHATPGQILSFTSYFTIILNATLVLTRIFIAYSRGAASAERLSEVLDEKKDLVVLPPTEAEENGAFLEFRNVTFSYNKNIPTVENISFCLNKGGTLGIIGGTGSGKSTLIQLLMRFYDPDEGSILLEGRDLRTIPAAELKKCFGVIFQNDFLMADTLRENVSFGRQIDESDLKAAAESAQALSFIEALEDGFDYALTTKGSNLSGGQRQRVLISRALAGDPEILILDDASSALDYKTDACLRTALRENYKNTTKIVVAQRISSIRDADLILVLEHGKICGMGTDEELSESCEIYREIAQSQMGEMQL